MLITLEQAIEFLLAGSVVALPTETVYGLASKLDSKEGIKKVFSLKKRPSDNPLIVHIRSKQTLYEYQTEKDDSLRDLIEYFWPGPLTVVIKVDQEKVPEVARAKLDTAAFRMPNEWQTLKIIEKVGPLVMPSANLSGRPSATRASHVEKDFGETFPIVDGGSSEKGLESTVILKVNDKWSIVRAGSITADQLESVLGYKPDIYHSKTKVVSPGTKYKHYAPQADLKLFEDKNSFENLTVLGFSNRAYPGAKSIYKLGSIENPLEVSKNLYHTLRKLDLDQVKEVFVDIDFPKEGLFKTIFERLQKASK